MGLERLEFLLRHLAGAMLVLGKEPDSCFETFAATLEQLAGLNMKVHSRLQIFLREDTGILAALWVNEKSSAWMYLEENLENKTS